MNRAGGSLIVGGAVSGDERQPGDRRPSAGHRLPPEIASTTARHGDSSEAISSGARLNDGKNSVLLMTVGKLCSDETGALLTMELILTATIVSLGAIVGLTSLRDAVSQEFGDVSAGLASIDHGYEFDPVSKIAMIDNVTVDLSVAGSNYTDLANFCEPADLDPSSGEPMCMAITPAAIDDEESVP